jgi:hypothetical protein
MPQLQRTNNQNNRKGSAVRAKQEGIMETARDSAPLIARNRASVDLHNTQPTTRQLTAQPDAEPTAKDNRTQQEA